MVRSRWQAKLSPISSCSYFLVDTEYLVLRAMLRLRSLCIRRSVRKGWEYLNAPVPKKHSLDRIFNACGWIPEKTDMVGRSASTSSIWFAVISTTTNANSRKPFNLRHQWRYWIYGPSASLSVRACPGKLACMITPCMLGVLEDRKAGVGNYQMISHFFGPRENIVYNLQFEQKETDTLEFIHVAHDRVVPSQYQHDLDMNLAEGTWLARCHRELLVERDLTLGLGTLHFRPPLCPGDDKVWLLRH
jgi:hypothetical protein